MGTFVNSSAFQMMDVRAVRSAVAGFFEANSWPAALVDTAEPASADDVAVYEPANGWTVVLWPQYFIEIAAAEHVSAQLAVVASTVSIHDGDYWRHVLVRGGVVLDRFASMPGYFTDDPAETERLRVKYRGHPDVIAETVGCGADAGVGEDGVEHLPVFPYPIADEVAGLAGGVMRSMARLRAAWVTHAALGCVVAPRIRTRRVACSMTART